jgi:hypothetical protein
MSNRVRTYSNKNVKEGYGRNLKMNDDTYALRRQVMDVIYEVKNLVNLPRIEVRINERPKVGNSIGLAYLNANVIFIPEHLFTKFPKYVFEVVLHEIVHASTGFEHDVKCPLMSPSIGSKPMTKANAIKVFRKYFD